MTEHTEFPSPDVSGLRSDDFEIYRQLEEVAETQGHRSKDFCRRGCESCWGSALPSDAYYPSSRLLDVNRLVVAKETPRGTLACVENTRRPSLRLCERETSKNGKEPTERAYRNYVRKIVPQLQSVHAVLESTAVQSVW